MIVVPCNGPLLWSGSNNFRLYLKICRSPLYFMTLGYTSRSVKPQESDLIEDGLLNLYILSMMHECHMTFHIRFIKIHVI